MSTDEVLQERRGQLGLLTLNRPAAMNALNHAMVRILQRALTQWEHDDGVATVLLSGAGERGLCAGGDIVTIYHDAREGGEESAAFWRDEYILNAAIKHYPKPYVAIMDGVVLGGGVGVSAHANFRVVTERSRIGMPETGIGFVPDVGGTFLLSRAPGELGTHLALTAGSVSGADAIALGLADYFVDSGDLPELTAALEHDRAEEVLRRYSQTPPPAPVLAEQDWIQRCYDASRVEEILNNLEQEALGGNEQAAKAAATISRKSPTALKVTLAALRRAAVLPSLEAVLDQEFRVSLRGLTWPDLAEGIRAQLIDKDRNPQWNPATLAEVTEASVDANFESLGERELGLATTQGAA